MARLYLRWQAGKIGLLPRPVHEIGKIRIGNFETFSQFWWWRDGIPAAEMRLLEACRRWLPPARRWIAVDVGAHLGHFALALAAIGFDEVHAFEPVPGSYDRLQQNIMMNTPLAGRIRTHPLGLADAPGSAAFAIRDRSPGQNRIATAADPDCSRIRCALTTLDEQFADDPEALLGIVKIDVEGFETAVLRGARRLLADNRVAYVYAEVIPQALREAGSSEQELVTMLNAAGFVIARYVDDPSPTFLQCDLAEALACSAGTRNVLFAHRAVLG